MGKNAKRTGLTNPKFLSCVAKAMTAANHVNVFHALLLDRHWSQVSVPVTSKTVTPAMQEAVTFTPACRLLKFT